MFSLKQLKVLEHI